MSISEIAPYTPEKKNLTRAIMDLGYWVQMCKAKGIRYFRLATMQNQNGQVFNKIITCIRTLPIWLDDLSSHHG